MTQVVVERKNIPQALKALAWGSVAYNVLVILWGAVVRATGSGAGCGNHWPLCNGQVIPVSPGTHTIIEFTHRMMTGGATPIILGVLIWTFRATSRKAVARTAAVWSGILLLTEALLGALLVKFGYVTDNQSNGRVVMQMVHFTNTLLLMAAITLTAWLLSQDEVRYSPRRKGLALSATLATVVVGATGSIAALADTLFPSSSFSAGLAADFAANSPLLVRIRWVHPAAAIIGLICAWGLARQVRSRAARWVVLLVIAQVLLGLADMLLLAPIWLQLLHLLGADLFWIALVVLAAEAVTTKKAATA